MLIWKEISAPGKAVLVVLLQTKWGVPGTSSRHPRIASTPASLRHPKSFGTLYGSLSTVSPGDFCTAVVASLCGISSGCASGRDGTRQIKLLSVGVISRAESEIGPMMSAS
ncbi:hypothetical protein O3P69_007444 [Scylla paramamosain]|uniref:Secreted protein n=1 Tax=Scylla paramamosain TaxID=85552 RepID=A0AAW0V3H3_SCYPA